VGTSERAYFGLTAEDLPFGVEPPPGMPVSAEASRTYDSIPGRLDKMAPGPIMSAFLSSVDVSQLSGFDQVVVLRAHQKTAGPASPFQEGTSEES